MSAAGFFDADAARRVMRRVRLRGKLQKAVASGTALLDSLDHLSQVERRRSLALVNRSSMLSESDVETRVGDQLVDAVASQDVREQELLQGADLILQLLDAMLDGVRHGLFSVQTRPEPTAADSAAHSQIEGLK